MSRATPFWYSSKIGSSFLQISHYILTTSICNENKLKDLRPRPIRRSKIPLRWQIQPRHALSISRVDIHRIPPPVRKHSTGIRDTKEDDNTANSKARVQSGCQYVVVFGPPGEELFFDDVVEDEVDNGPAGVVDAGCLLLVSLPFNFIIYVDKI